MEKSSIVIKETPPGFAPRAMREQWVDVKIPLATDKDIRQNIHTVLRFGSYDQKKEGYLVTKEAAIKALNRAKKIAAAEFWESLEIGYFLEFDKQLCSLLRE